jgi:hypothetical protein
MAFVKRKIDLTFQLGQGSFGLSGFDTVKLEGLRVIAEITGSGSPRMGQANVRVYGLTPDLLADLSRVIRSPNGVLEWRHNTLIIEAGDEGAVPARVFQGQVIMAAIDMNGAPDSVLTVVANAGAFDKVRTIPAVSFPGPADVAVIMNNLAATMNRPFEPNGVSVILDRPVLWGSAMDQAQQAADQANVNWVVDNSTKTLAIWPRGEARGGGVPVVSPETGMIGYPTNFNLGVTVSTLFNPLLMVGQKVEVRSSLKFANGFYGMFNIAHTIHSEVPDGSICCV